MSFVASISKEEVSQLPVEKFEGAIHTIDNLHEMEKAVNYLREFEYVGIDTETRPAFKKGKVNDVALLQISTNDRCFLFRLNVIGIPSALQELLKDSNVKKIGLSVKDDIASINRKIHVDIANCIDMQQYVKDFGIQDNSLAKIYAIIFGKRISKAQRLSNWEAPLLTDKQNNMRLSTLGQLVEYTNILSL